MHIALYFWHTNPVITKNFISGGKYEQKLQQQHKRNQPYNIFRRPFQFFQKLWHQKQPEQELQKQIHPEQDKPVLQPAWNQRRSGLIFGMSMWWSVLLPYCPPDISATGSARAGYISDSYFSPSISFAHAMPYFHNSFSYIKNSNFLCTWGKIIFLKFFKKSVDIFQSQE